MTVNLWSQTAATNATVDSTVNFREGQAPSTLNNSTRAVMAAIAKWRDDISGNLETGGSSTAYTLTTNQGLTPIADGYSITARMHAANGASPTLNVDSTGAKAIRSANGTAVGTGLMFADSIQRFTYDSSDDCWYVHGFFPSANLVAPTGTKMIFWQTSAPTGWTKDTNHNDKALRITTGTASTGGTVAFETAFASHTPAGTVGDTTLTSNQIPAHRHFVWADEILGNVNPGVTNAQQTAKQGRGGGGSSSFDYAAEGTSTAATVGRTSETGGGASHTHTFTGTAINLDVSFVDVILATKD
jgi:hypothetical protein